VAVTDLSTPGAVPNIEGRTTVNEDQQVSEPPAATATPGLPAPRDDPPRMPSGTTSNSAPNLAAHQLHVAMTWVGRGEQPIPCSAKDKAPMVPGFGKDATPEQLARFSDPRQIHEWWTGKYKRAHVGLLTRRLLVIDLDALRPGAAPLTGRWEGCEHGLDVLEILMREAGVTDFPETYTVETPSADKPVRGQHLYFQQPPDGAKIGCATGEGLTPPHLGPLVDVRGVGGVIIAAGSHSAAQGRPYTRTSPPELRPQPLPAWLLERLRPSTPARQEVRPAAPVRRIDSGPTSSRADRYAAAALEGAAADVAALREGDHRRDRVYAAACRLAELSETAPSVLTESAVYEQLLAAALACGIKGGQRQAEKCIRNGWERGLQGGTGTGAGAA
jgi:hypothetical protein